MRKLFTLTLALLASFSLWAGTTAPTGAAHTPGSVAEANLVSKWGKKYEVYFSNNASKESLLVGSNTSETTQATGTDKWCNIGSGCGSGANNISTAFTVDEFVSNVKSSNNKYINVQSTGASEKNIVMVVSGFDSIAVFAKSSDVNVYAEIWGGSSYGDASALTVGHTKNASSHYKQQFALDKTKQYRLTIAYGTSGSSNKNVVAFSLCYTPCAEPAAPTISGTESYTVGETITLTATTNGSNHGATTTYTWYKGDNWASATKVQDAKTAANNGHKLTKTAALDDAGTYWCEAANGDCTSHNITGKTIAVSAPSTPSHSISYTNTKNASTAGLPTEYNEGIGVASFDALADVTNFHFTGWSPTSIAADATTDQTITAQWVDAYDVTFNVGDGSGTAPTTFQKWEGATFNLPGQGEMIAPSGKAFDGWKANGTGDKLAADYEYTMTATAVEFVAQWKSVPQTIFHYQQSNLSSNLAAGTYDATGGTITTSAEMSKESAAYNAAVPNDLKGGANVGKLGSNAAYIQLTLTSGKFVEGDTIYICGYNPYKVSTTTSLTGDIVDVIATGTAKGDYNIGYGIVPDGVSQNSIYLSREEGTGTGFAAVKVIRPAARDTVSRDTLLSDVKVNDRSIHADSLTLLKAGPAFSLKLKDSYVEAPVIKFNERTVITFAEGDPTIKDKVYTVTASLVDGNWNAQATINEITYTVTASKPSTYSVVYKDGNTTLDTEIVLVGEHPAGITNPTKAINTFAGWMNGDDVVNPTELDGKKDQVITLQAQWTKLYATNIDLEAFIDDKGISGKWDSLLTANNYAISSTNNVSLDAPEGKPADKGLKIKKSGTIVSFNVHAGKMVVLKTGMLSGAQISVDGGANYTNLTSSSSSTGASIVSYHYNAAEATYKIKMTTDAYNIIQSISITDPFTVSCSGTTNGSLSADTLKARPNETITLTVTPDMGYEIASVIYNDGENHDATVVDQTHYSFTLPAKNVTVTATFAAINYDVIFAKGEGSGEMEPLANKHVGDEVTLPACDFDAPDGKKFAAWTSDDVTIADGKFTMPAADVTITATYTLVDYDVTYTSPTNGSYTIKVGDAEAGSASTTANYGQTIILTVTPSTGYVVDAVKYNDGEDHVLEGSENVYSFSMPNKAVVVSATFKAEGGGTGFDNTADEIKAVKFIENGQLFIRRGEKVYTITGEEVK